MDYLEIENWESFQHYKKRHPPWIKFYHSLLYDYAYGCLPNDSKLLLISLFLLAGRTENKIPNDPVWIKEETKIKGDLDIQRLIDAGFLSYNGDDSKLIAD